MKFILLAILLFQFNANYINCNSLQKLLKEDVLKFSFQNCGPSTDPLIIEALSIAPDPIHFPGVLNITAAVSLARNLTSPLTVSIDIKKKVGPFVIDIPCVNNVGSCTYNDICSMLPPSPNQCPEFFIQHQLPCDCPFPSGKYGVQNLVIQIETKEPVPNGQYQITADITSNKNHVGCLNIVANYQ